MSKDNIPETRALIIKDLALQDELPETSNTLDDLKQQLIPIINHLLDHDMSRLLTALYRIDVSEKKVKATLLEENPALLAESMADLIIGREAQKVITRRMYS